MALPNTYTELTYIQCSGTQYINTGVNGTSNIAVEVSFTDFTRSNSRNYLFGVSNNSWSGSLGINHTSGGGFYAYYNYDGYVGARTQTSGTYKLEAGKVYYDGSQIYTNSYSSFSWNYPIYLFCINWAGEAQYFSNSFKLTEAKIWDGSTLIRDFIPAKRKSDNAVGLYDIANDNFYTNAGTGTFVAGPAVVHKISYVTDYGSVTDKEIDVPYSLVAADLPDLTYSGKGFNGWYYENTYTTKAKVDDVVNSSITLYAKWLDKFTIHYEAKYGTAPADKVVDPPSYILTTADLPTISIAGFKATDWYYNNTYTNKANAGDSIVADTTLYAKFVEVPIIVDGKRKIEMKVKLNNTVDATDADYDTLHPITEASVVEYTKNGVLSDVGTVLSTTAGNMDSIVATATDIEIRQHGMFIIAKDTEVPNSAWVSNATYSDYPFRAAITVPGCTADHVPDVYFDVAEVNLNIFAPISETAFGVVYIYAKQKPGRTITIPTIKLVTEADKISTVKVLGAIQVDTKPNKIEYVEGETLSYSGMIVKAYYSNGSVATISNYTVNPANGTVLSEGITTCTISYTEDGVTKTDSFNITVNPTGPKIVTWADGTDAEILAMVQAADAGTINLTDYWTVGDERTISLNSIASSGTANGISWSVDETHSSQTIKLVLMDTTASGIDLINSSGTVTGKPHFIVGQKNALSTGGYMNASNNNTGGYSASARAKWCDSGYWNAIPSTLRPIFKKFRWKGGVGGNATSGLQNEDHWFSLTPVKCITGETSNSQSDEAANFTNWSYYTNTNNRKKARGEGGSNQYYWCASTSSNNSSYPFLSIYSDGVAWVNTATKAYGLAPFGCI